jgi:glutaredoxin
MTEIGKRRETMKRGALPAVLILLALLAGGPALAEKNIWIDEKGVAHPAEKGSSGSEAHQVELYVTIWCPYCKQATQFFRSRGIPFTVYDIEKDKGAAQRKNQLDSRNGVPFALINGQAIHGFSAEAYERALERRR